MTAMTEITRNGAKSARGLVSIQSRYNQIIDESSSTGKKLSAWYKEHNIAIKDQNGQLRSFFDVGKDVSKIWDDLSDNEKKYYLNTQAGANQSQNLAALMRNYKTAIDATNTALNSNGSAAKENARYMESMEGKLQNLKSAWENFSRTMVNSDMLKTGIDALTKSLDFLATDAGQSIIKLGVAFGSAYLAMKPFMGIFRGLSVVKGMGKFAGSTKLVTKALKGGGKHIDDAALGFTRLTRATTKATPAVGKLAPKMAGLASVFSGGAVGWGLLGAAGITAGILALNKAIDGETDPEKKYEKSKKKLDELNDSYEKINAEIKKYEDLRKQRKKEHPDDKDAAAYSKQEEHRLGLLKQQLAVLKEQRKVQQEITNKRWEKKTKTPQTKSKEVRDKSTSKSAALGKGGVSMLGATKVSTAKQLGHTDKLTSAMKDYEYTLSQVGAKYEKTGRIGQKSMASLQSGIDNVKKEQKEWVDHFGGVEKMPKEYRKIYDESKKVTDAYDSLADTQAKLAGGDWSKLGTKDAEQATQAFKDLGGAIGISVNKSGELESINYGQFTSGLQAAGFTADQTRDALIQLGQENPDVKVNIEGTEVAGDQIANVMDFLDKLNGNDANATVEVDGTEYAVEDIGSLDNYLRLIDGKTTTGYMTIEGAAEAFGKIQEVKNADIPPKTLKIGGNSSGAKKAGKDANAIKVKNKTLVVKGKKDGSFTSAKSSLENIKNKSVTLSVWANISDTAKKLMTKLGFAKGTRNAPEGLAEVNEQGYEFIRDAKTGSLRIAGGGKRTVTHLNAGDQVYTHAESKRMISDKDDIEVPQHKKGKKKKGGGKGAKKRAKKLSKAQSAYNTKIDKYKNQYEAALKALQYKRDTKHISDLQYQREYNALYNRYNKLIKNTKPAVVKGKGAQVKRQTGLGTDARYDLGTSQADLRHEQKTKQIESLIEDARGTDDDLTKALSAINAARRAQDISAEEQADYTKQAYQRNLEYNMEMYKNNKVTYTDMRKIVEDYHKNNKITAAEYYDYLEDLAESQLDKAKKRIEDEKKLNDDKYSLAKAFVERRISELEKENEEQEQQNDLIAKQNDLMKAQNKMVKVYREGKGFVYEKDTEAIKEATQALQEYKTEQKNPELEKWEKVQALFEDMEALAEIKELENKVGASATGLFGGFGTNLDAWTQWIKENLATGMGLESLADSMDDLTYYDDIFKFLQGANGTVSESQISSAISKYRFASGTDYVPRTGFARVSEQGYEIALLGQGDAVMPHDVSKNLMAWGAYSPVDFAKQSGGNGDITYNFDRLVLPNVANANDFIRELKQLPNKALQFGTSRS